MSVSMGHNNPSMSQWAQQPINAPLTRDTMAGLLRPGPSPPTVARGLVRARPECFVGRRRRSGRRSGAQERAESRGPARGPRIRVRARPGRGREEAGGGGASAAAGVLAAGLAGRGCVGPCAHATALRRPHGRRACGRRGAAASLAGFRPRSALRNGPSRDFEGTLSPAAGMACLTPRVLQGRRGVWPSGAARRGRWKGERR